jgi:hypothetical protein
MREIVHSSFGDHSRISGSIGSDWFTIGSMRCFSDFGLILRGHGPAFQHQHFSVILGLGLSPPSPHIRPLIDSIFSQSNFSSLVFSLYLSRYPSQDSALLFGDPDPQYFHAPLIFVPVSHDQFWQVALLGVRIDQSLQHFCAAGCQMLVDSGTSLISGPSNQVELLLQQLDIAPDCHNIDQLPAVYFELDGIKLALEPRDYVIRLRSKSGSFSCSSSFTELDIAPPRGPLWVVGDVFLRKFFTAFDRGNHKIGFAEARFKI